MKVNELSTLDITDVALGGKALGRQDGRVVFVDRGLPGDRVEVLLTRSRRGWAEARLVRILTPSPHRIAARCPHVEHCGGCRLQELPYDEQLLLKRRQVVETLQHLGGIPAPPVLDIVAAPEVFHYRNKMEFSFMPGADAAPVLGLHERGNFDRIFSLETCLLPSPLTVEVVRFTQGFAAEHRWSAYHPAQHTGVVRFLTIRHLPHTDHCAVQLLAARDEVRG
ncbi:MAG: TRAM domain-containing protein, partial [Candidatus Eisenbacteria bacterium]